MYLILEHSLIVLGVLSVAIAIILALQPRRTPQGSVAWILFIILLPYIAVPVFLVLGFRKSGRAFPAIRFSPHPQARPAQFPPLSGYFAKIGAPEAVCGNRLTLHATPEAASLALDAVIDSAESRLDILLYIVAKDDSGRRFLQRLTAKAQAGVAVRLSIDWLGSLRRPWPELNAFIEAGGELRFFSPLDHLTDTTHLNLRNHRKVVIADAQRVWSGGRNVGDEYLASPKGAWNDLSCSIEGPLVANFNEVFASDWEVSGAPLPAPAGPAAPPCGDAVLQLMPAGPDEVQDVLHDGLVAAIYRANHRIWIATPYFVPTDALLQALATAVQAGVDLRIYIPQKSNQWTTDLARGAYLRALQRHGAQIHRYMPGMMHAKAGVIDDAAWVGSANFDIRSMFLNFELAVMAYDPGTVAALEDWFIGLERDCAPGLSPATPFRRLVEGVFRLGSPIL